MKGEMEVKYSNLQKNKIVTAIKVVSAMLFLVTFAMLSGHSSADEPRIVSVSRVPAEDRAKMREAAPDKPIVTPKKKRHLLIYDVNGTYGGHGAIAWADIAFEIMGQKTGAFQVTLSRDNKVFRWESLQKYDAIFLNNIVGNPFNNNEYRGNILRFVREGGGLMGVHGTTMAFVEWSDKTRETFPEFANMIGARGANHRAQDETVHIKVEEPNHPLTKLFPAEGFEYKDEFFRFSNPYSRSNLRILLSIDTSKSNLFAPPYDKRKERADNDYAIAWVRSYGKGRVFYCSLAHGNQTFMNPQMLKFYLGGIQYVLGDLSAPDEPR